MFLSLDLAADYPSIGKKTDMYQCQMKYREHEIPGVRAFKKDPILDFERRPWLQLAGSRGQKKKTSLFLISVVEASRSLKVSQIILEVTGS
jgi:hypothetical protein